MSKDDVDKFLPGGANADIVRPMDEAIADADRLAADSVLRSELEAFKKQGTLPPMLPDQGHREHLEREILASRQTAPERRLAKVIAPGPRSLKKTEMGLGPAADAASSSGETTEVQGAPPGPALEHLHSSANREALNVDDASRAPEENAPDVFVKLAPAESRTTARAAPRIQVADDLTVVSARRARAPSRLGIAAVVVVTAAIGIALMAHLSGAWPSATVPSVAARGRPSAQPSSPAPPASGDALAAPPAAASVEPPSASHPASSVENPAAPRPPASAHAVPSARAAATASARTSPAAPSASQTPTAASSDRMTPRFH